MNNIEIRKDTPMGEDEFKDHKSRMQSDSNVMNIVYNSPEHETSTSFVQGLPKDEIYRRLEISNEDDWRADPYLYRALLDAYSSK